MFLWGKDPYALPPFSKARPYIFWGRRFNCRSSGFWPSPSWRYRRGFFFNRTLTGKAMTACAFNPLAARLVGINVQKMVFFLSP